MADNHFVYILECRDKTLYTGYTTNVPERLKKHELGKGAKYTRGRGPFRVKYIEELETKKAAMKREYKIKQLRKAEKLELIHSYKGATCNMNIQSSYKWTDRGKLYVVPTPIGHLDDMTYRAVATLQDVDLILAEDTRHTKKLLQHFSIQSRLLSYHEHNTEARMQEVLERLFDGENLALVSDAGMPAISDPGYELVKEAIHQDIHVIVLPGANAAICALVGSGLPTDEFLFFGFLPRKQKVKIETLERLRTLQASLILYESPYRLKDTLRLIEKYIGNRQISISREMTKVHEQYIRGSCSEVVRWVEESDIKGECCIIIEGRDEQQLSEKDAWWQSISISAHVQAYEATGMPHKQAMKQAAVDRKVAKRAIYQAIHVDTEDEEN